MAENALQEGALFRLAWHHGNAAVVILFDAAFFIQAQTRLALLFIRSMTE
jgi:hypothetical protein